MPHPDDEVGERREVIQRLIEVDAKPKITEGRREVIQRLIEFLTKYQVL